MEKINFYNSISKKLKKIRKKTGFSQDFIAKELGIIRQAVINIEAGKRKVDSFELFKLADLYNISVIDLITEQVPVVSNFRKVIIDSNLSETEKKGLFEFQNIYNDYEYLKNINI